MVKPVTPSDQALRQLDETIRRQRNVIQRAAKQARLLANMLEAPLEISGHEPPANPANAGGRHEVDTDGANPAPGDGGSGDSRRPRPRPRRKGR